MGNPQWVHKLLFRNSLSYWHQPVAIDKIKILNKPRIHVKYTEAIQSIPMGWMTELQDCSSAYSTMLLLSPPTHETSFCAVSTMHK